MPKKGRARRVGSGRTKWTIRAREKFLAVLRKTCNVTLAAHAIGMSRSSVYQHREDDKELARLWDEAVTEGLDLLEGEAWKRATEGWEEPVFYQGDECGQVRRYSDRMLEILLKGHHPEKYRERFEHEFKGDLSKLTPEELQTLRTFTEKMNAPLDQSGRTQRDLARRG